MAGSGGPQVTWQFLRAVRDSDLCRRDRLVAFALATFADPDGTNARPGLTRLAKATGMGRSSVSEGLSSLVEAGWLAVVVRGTSSPGGQRRTSEYRLRVPASTPRLVPVANSPGAEQSPDGTEPVLGPDRTSPGAGPHLPTTYTEPAPEAGDEFWQVVWAEYAEAVVCSQPGEIRDRVAYKRQLLTTGPAKHSARAEQLHADFELTARQLGQVIAGQDGILRTAPRRERAAS